MNGQKASQLQGTRLEIASKCQETRVGHERIQGSYWVLCSLYITISCFKSYFPTKSFQLCPLLIHITNLYSEPTMQQTILWKA